MNFKKFLLKVSHAIGANLISLMISILTTLIVPKLIGVEEFSYFQLYLFYASYIGLLHFGWNDGILLRLGGKRYSELDKESIYSQFLIFLGQQLLTAFVLGFLALNLIQEPNLRFIIGMTAICISISGPMYMLLYVLEATSRIKEYARILIIQRILFGALIMLIFLLPTISYALLITSDLIARASALMLALFFCREIIRTKISRFKFPRVDIRENISTGMPLMLSAMAGSLIIGIVRLGIERNWEISVFGKVSLALSLSTMILTMIVAVGQVLFPLLRRAPEHLLPRIYETGRTMLSSLSIPALSLYFVIVPFIEFWLPAYSDSAQYLGILFPLFIYQIQTSILFEPYLKTFRRQKTLLLVNLSVLSFSCFITWLSAYHLKSLTLCLVSIIFLVAIRAISLEIIVASAVKVKFKCSILTEASVVVIFLVGVLLFNTIPALLLLTLSQVIWFTINRKAVGRGIEFLRA